jgi:hypothetical protein
MDMKQILQALDKASSRKVEGADDMRRFVSAVRALNAPIEECSGYIPKNDKEAKDPRWSTALTVDIQPGAVEKNLKALSLAEMDKSQKGAPGWNISDDESGGKEKYVKPSKSKDVAKDALKSLNKEMDKTHKKVKEGRKNFLDYLNEAEQNVAEVSLVDKLEWPEVVNKVNSAMKATGWKGGRKGDDAYIFSSKGQETDDQYYFVVIENVGKGHFSYALGTVEEGDPYIDDSYKGTLPNTEASVSELINMIRDGFGLNEGLKDPKDNPCWKGYKPVGTKKKGGRTVPNCVPKE